MAAEPKKALSLDEVIDSTGFTDKQQSTFQYADTHPALPVPDLQQTLAKYLQSVRPFVTATEYRTTERIVREFARGAGKRLHEKLIERAKFSLNWLEQWWLEEVYMSNRVPLAPFCNFGGPGPYTFHVWPSKPGTQIQRAALSLYYYMVYWDLLRKEKIRPDGGSQGDHWDMDQYLRIFNGCRIPREGKDTYTCKFKLAKEGTGPTHVIVICKNRFFQFDITAQDGSLLTAPEMEVQLQHVKDICDQSPAGPGLGALTSENRDTWAKLRNHLIQLHPNNLRSLEAIQDSIGAVVLDEHISQGLDDLAMYALCPAGTNIWFDKHICWLVLPNGEFTVNCDHAPYDAIVIAVMSLFCNRCLEKVDGRWTGTHEIRKMAAPQELAFHLDDTLLSAIDVARHKYQQMADNVEVISPLYKGFGKQWLRKRDYHPDTFMQVVLQYAYYRLYGRPAPTYETATTRKFHHGRTETVRSCTTDAMTWAKAMLNPSTSDQEKLRLFEVARKTHMQLMTDAYNGQGIDRHLLGMGILAAQEGMETPEIFKDPAYTKSGGNGNFILSTSFIGYSIVHGGVAPMCTNGYGFFYCIEPDRIKYFISSWVSDKETSCYKLFSMVTKCLDEVKGLIERNEMVPAQL